MVRRKLFLIIITPLCITYFIFAVLNPHLNRNEETSGIQLDNFPKSDVLCSYPQKDNTSKINANPKTTYQELEKSMCSESNKIVDGNTGEKLSSIKGNNTKESLCPKYGIVTVQQKGSFEDQLWEYAAVWAIAQLTGLQPYVPRCIRVTLDEIFRTLSVPDLREIDKCEVDLKNVVKSPEEWMCFDQSIILPSYPFKMGWVLRLSHKIVEEFTFRRWLQGRSQKILKKAARKSRIPSGIFVGVHVGRKDSIKGLKGPKADESFYLKAMDHFKVKYLEVTFLVVSDDLVWCNEKFGKISNVYVSESNPIEMDLAILAACNYSIFAHGTSGIWGALLSRGETIYFDDASESMAAVVAKFLPNWHTV